MTELVGVASGKGFGPEKAVALIQEEMINYRVGKDEPVGA
jgi:hypothetical protein